MGDVCEAVRGVAPGELAQSHCSLWNCGPHRPGGDSRHGDGIRPFSDKEFLAGGHEIGTALIAMLGDRRSGDARHIVILS